MDWLSDPQAWIGFLTLTVLEIVLGIDNVVFISILAGKLPPADREKARRTGLALAMVTRILLLLSLSWIIRLTAPLFTVMNQEISGRDLVLIGVTLIGEGFDHHIPKGYIYFAMGFSVAVEMLNLRLRKKAAPVELHSEYTPGN